MKAWPWRAVLGRFREVQRGGNEAGKLQSFMSVLPIIWNYDLCAACSPDCFKAGYPALGGFCQKSNCLRKAKELLGIDHQGMLAPNLSENMLGVLVVTEKGKSSVLCPGPRPFLNEPEKILCCLAELLKRDVGTDQVAHAAWSKHKL